MTNETDYAWAAGIVDGEGCISVSWTKQTNPSGKSYEMYRLGLSIKQSSDNGIPKMLIKFRDIFGVGTIPKPYISKGRKPSYRYQAYRKDAQRVLQLIWPYLGDVKRRQATNAGFNYQ